ncbi:hypothetical protein GCM10010251_25610 [Streptomyces aurantiogriseus]|uniref:Uncharacterized protein n=1 Tax=Streptomyces aurantiogriseus TaxID=66870 RepID=A0A918F6A4_9ACTN|nr:hypothetical protein GCM10010251_25610 [Streptomyces aurantiogriseus]
MVTTSHLAIGPYRASFTRNARSPGAAHLGTQGSNDADAVVPRYHLEWNVRTGPGTCLVAACRGREVGQCVLPRAERRRSDSHYAVTGRGPATEAVLCGHAGR